MNQSENKNFVDKYLQLTDKKYLEETVTPILKQLKTQTIDNRFFVEKNRCITISSDIISFAKKVFEEANKDKYVAIDVKENTLRIENYSKHYKCNINFYCNKDTNDVFAEFQMRTGNICNFIYFLERFRSNNPCEPPLPLFELEGKSNNASNEFISNIKSMLKTNYSDLLQNCLESLMNINNSAYHNELLPELQQIYKTFDGDNKIYAMLLISE